MAITYPLAVPTSPKPREFAFQFAPNTAATTSIYSGATQTYEHDGLVWSASVSLPPLLNTSQAREWHGFLASLNGQRGTFTMGPPQHATPSGTQAADISIRVAALAQAKTLEVKGMTAAATILRGDLISVASRLYMVMEDVTANGSGEADLTLSHGLREAAAVDVTVGLLNPVGTWRLRDPNVSRQIQVGGVSSVSFAIVEAI